MRSITVLALSLLLTYVSAANVAVVPPGPARTGHSEADLLDADGKLVLHYVIDAPARLPEQRELSLIVVMHENSGNPARHAKIWKAVVEAAGVDQRYVIFALKSQGKDWENRTDDAPPVTRAMEWMLATYPIDRRRVHLVGFGGGGFYAAQYGFERQEVFATITVFSCSFRPPPPPLGGPDLGARVYITQGMMDGFAYWGHEMRDYLWQGGYRYVQREQREGRFDYGNGHTMTLDNLRWMDQCRNQHVAPEPDDLEFIKQAKSLKRAEAVWSDPALAARAARIGGLHAQEIALGVLKGRNEAARLGVAKAAATCVFGADTLVALGRVLSDKSTSSGLRSAALAALTPAASWNWSEARTALTKFAADGKQPLEQRLNAIDALAEATSLFVLAVDYDDPVMVPALVELLADADVAIRARAFAILQKLSHDIFGYDPAIPEQRKAMTEWRQWAQMKCGFFRYGPPGR